jgi:hypothetical protein
VLFALIALVAIPVVGSLVAVREEGSLTVRLGRATVLAAVAIIAPRCSPGWFMEAKRAGSIPSLR